MRCAMRRRVGCLGSHLRGLPTPNPASRGLLRVALIVRLSKFSFVRHVFAGDVPRIPHSNMKVLGCLSLCAPNCMCRFRSHSDWRSAASGVLFFGRL